MPVIRCFKCQSYGHMSRRCSDAQVCLKCAGSHLATECDASMVCCINWNKKDFLDCSHQANSPVQSSWSIESQLLKGNK